ncbi:hypothetical protein SAMN05421640_1404 [Ekhidna lutea]|uniref:Uncharacterized protein n=1 Tax=Ekhidna lutea TaxID=447679 RepID=A0A239HMQ9_EKHLU|nr:hypothetical protein [Ekhidna lutea]SNS82679.1 hypothetical protein SAMN05421640_1404 [Ekhidna lutea]
MLPKIIFLALSSLININNSFQGQWVWVENSSSKSFNLELTVIETNITGQHCVIAMNGNRIDCIDSTIDDSVSINGVTSGNKATITFKSSYSNEIGEAELTLLSNGDLKWFITKEPTEQVYFPKNAIMKKK